MKYTYLLIDFFSVLFPFLFSFHPKLKFYRSWPAFLPALALTALLFIGWDIYFTDLKVWGFNPTYLTGIYIYNLPVEEVLFFICIPYACVFTYTSLKLFFTVSSAKAVNSITVGLIAVSIVMAAIFHKFYYTSSAFGVLACLLFIANYLVKVSWLLQFYITYLILLLPFFIVNGMLTGTGLDAPVVWYNSAEMLNIRLLTIPVEDVFYGMDLILLNMLFFGWIAGRIFNGIKSRKKAFILQGAINP